MRFKCECRFWQKYLPLTLIVIIGSFYFGLRQLKSPSINYLSAPEPSPAESSGPLCYEQIVSYRTYRESCSNTEPSHFFIDYRCGYEKETRTSGQAGICSNDKDLLANAAAICRKNICPSPSPIPSPVYSPYPSPSPSTSPSPKPSPSVLSGVSCQTNVYQLRPTDFNEIGDLKQYMTVDRLVNTSTHKVKAGDRYIYNLVINNYSGQTITGTLTARTQNVHETSEPMKILKTFNNCTINVDKTIKCGPSLVPKIPSTEKFSTEMGMLVQITPEVYKSINTSTYFNYTIDRVKAIPPQLTGSCGFLMLAEPQPKPSPRCIRIGSRQICL